MDPTSGTGTDPLGTGRLVHSRLLIRLVGVAGVLCISWAAIFVRLASVEPATATLFRTLYALPLVALIWFVVRRRDHRPIRARGVAFLAGVALSIDLTLWHHTIDLIGAGLATVLANVQVIFVAALAWLIWQERPTSTARWAVPVILGGVALISGLGREDAYGDDPVAGVAIGLVTGLAYAAFLLTFRASNRAALAPTPGPVLDATAGAAVGALVIGLVQAGLFDVTLDLTPAWPAHGWLMLLAVVAQTAGWMLIAVALPRLPALETSVLLLIQPVGALLWARLIFGESLGVFQAIGVVVILAGVLVGSGRGLVERSADPTPVETKSPV